MKQDIKEYIVNELKKLTKLKEINLEVPPTSNLGDYAFPCYPLAKKLKKNPEDIAVELSQKIEKNDVIQKIETEGPYINFFVNKAVFTEKILKEVFGKKEDYGKGTAEKSKVMVEFFHANTHKGVHIGHVRNMCLGDSLARILTFNGLKVYRTNYQGDIGPHVAKCLWGYLRYKHKPPKEFKGEWLGQIYSKANKGSEGNKKFEQEITEINNKLYSKDKKIVELWKETRKWCLDDFNQIYNSFNVKFDRLYFESEVEELGKKTSLELLKKGIAQESEGAVIVDLKEYNLGVAVLLTKHGNALYHAKDLGLAKLQFSEFKIDKCIHVVGKEQELYFKQLFKIFELMKFKEAMNSYHLIYGLVMLPEGKMSSREGSIVLYVDLIKKLREKANKEVKKRHKDWSKKKIKETAEKIAFSALKFSMLNKENNKMILFDWEKAIDFEGETGPYVQYVYARISSILRKSKTEVTGDVNYMFFDEEAELVLIKLLGKYPKVLENAATNYKPHLVVRYLLELAQKFNEFYQYCPILQSKEHLMQARLLLAYCVREVIANGLKLLGIDVMEEM